MPDGIPFYVFFLAFIICGLIRLILVSLCSVCLLKQHLWLDYNNNSPAGCFLLASAECCAGVCSTAGDREGRDSRMSVDICVTINQRFRDSHNCYNIYVISSSN